MTHLIRALVLLSALSAGFGVLGAPAEAEEALPLGSQSCSCPTIPRCGKVAAGCSASCGAGETASCSCANPSVLCNANGPYGTFQNVCRCL